MPNRPYDKISTLEADMQEVKNRLSVLELNTQDAVISQTHTYTHTQKKTA